MRKIMLVILGLLLTITIAPVAKATLISSFNATADLTVTADFDIFDFETFLDDSDLITAGASSGSVSGSGDDLFDLPTGDSTSLSAYANGDVTGSPGSVEGLYLSSGEFFIENTDISPLAGEITFDLALVASIFTDTFEEAALAFSAIVVGFEKYDANGELIEESIFIDELLEFDSSFDGVGMFGGELDKIEYSTSSSFSLEQNESIFYFMELDASGFANTERATTVPEPSTAIIFALALVCFSCRSYLKA